jgi:L-aspartate oxidase
VLVDHDGGRIMEGEHELGDLAPRDVVTKAITRRMHATGHDHMWLDGRRLGARTWRRRFPTILAMCRERGVDPVTEPIPIAPASHHAAGGVRTDLCGRTGVPGLYAAGEVACAGIHGANRLASNSLLEGLVLSRRLASALSAELPAAAEPEADTRPARVVDAGILGRLQDAMSEGVGVLRSADGLARASAELTRLAATTGESGPAGWAATNLVTVACAIALAAFERRETRGAHWREDFPRRDDASFAGHLDITLDGGELAASFVPATLSDLPWR